MSKVQERINNLKVEFLDRVLLIHNDKYDYSLINVNRRNDSIIIICPIHGNFTQRMNYHLSGGGCPNCYFDLMSKSKSDTNDLFIKKAQKIHNYKYDYSLVHYKLTGKLVNIICKEHGIFKQTPNNHLRGQGCIKCNRNSIFKRNSWIKQSKDKEGIFYIIKCWNEVEEFYKLGVTCNSIKQRYNSKKDMPYNYKIIKEIKSQDLGYIWDLEKRFMRKIKTRYYLPKIKFGGHKTECFI